MKLKLGVGLLVSLSIVCALFDASPLLAAEKIQSPQPKVGLALGGGSARGFVHIGVLRWMEENHIPVDYVAGTSMGGLIGGLYVMGMSPAQIEQFVKGIDWDQMFESTPPFNALRFRRKEDWLDYPAEMEIGLRDKIYIPNGLSVYQIDLLLSRLALPYSPIDHFDQLPIPYRCVATDIRNSEKVVLENGSLSEALRATMSVPGVFVPIEREGRLLVDGGLIDNVPADVAKNMGADIMIAVNCNEANVQKDMRGLDAVFLNSINSVIIDNTKRALKMADIVIYPEIPELSSLDWKLADQFIAAGYQAAVSEGETLKKFAVDERSWWEYLQKRAARRREQAATPETIEVQGTDENNQVEIKKALSRFVGKPIEPLELEAALIEILGSDLYESLMYEMVIREYRPALLIRVKEKSYGPPFIRFMPEINFFEERTEVNLHSRITSYNLWGLHSELRTDLVLGTAPGLKSELYKPFSKYGWFVTPSLMVEHTNHSLFNGGVRKADYTKLEQVVGIDLGYNLNKFVEVRLGYQVGKQKVDTELGIPVSSDDGTVCKAELKWSYIKINSESALQGFFCEVKSDWYTKAPDADSSFSTAETALTWLAPINNKDSLITLLAAGATSGDAPLLQQFRLGGPFEMGIYASDELVGANYLLGTIGILHYMGQPLGMGRLYLCALAENGGVFDSWSEIDYTSNLSIGFVGVAPIGKYYVGSSFGEDGDFRMYLLMGRLF